MYVLRDANGQARAKINDHVMDHLIRPSGSIEGGDFRYTYTVTRDMEIDCGNVTIYLREGDSLSKIRKPEPKPEFRPDPAPAPVRSRMRM